MYSWPWRFLVLSLTVLLLVYSSTGWCVQINAEGLPNESELLGNTDVESVGREAESTAEQAIDHLNDARASQVLSVGSSIIEEVERSWFYSVKREKPSQGGSSLLNPGSGSLPLADASAHVLGTLSLLHTEGAVDVVCDRDVSWLPDAQLFSGMNVVWHDVSVPLCINGQPNLELLSFSGYGTGGYMGDLFELLSVDGLSAITEWVESCSSGYSNDFEITVPAQVAAKPVYDRLCWTAVEGAYQGGALSVEGEECANCSIASIADLFPCRHGGTTFCNSEGYDYSVFDRSYDSSCSAQARRSWLAMGVVAAEALHQDTCRKTQPTTRLYIK